MRIILFSLIFILISGCASKGRKNIATSDVTITGGIYNEHQWNSTLNFERTSWFKEANMHYDILISKIDKKSDFSKWLGADQSKLKDCDELYVTLLYADLNAQYGIPFLTNQFMTQGLGEVVLPDFSANLKAHNNYRDWRLTQHKIKGYCRTNSNSKDILISIPGFKSQEL